MVLSANAPGRKTTRTNGAKTRIIQISDTHLFGNGDADIRGINTLNSVNAVIDHIISQQYQADAIIVTGDLTNDESIESYRQLKQCLLPLNIPFYWLRGNHDDGEIMAQACPSAMVKQININNWQVLLLNSQSPGQTSGKLIPNELSWLAHTLDGSPDKHTLLALHHPPYILGSAWMDAINLENFMEFQELIASYHQVKGVIHGHVHQEFETLLKGDIPCYATPSCGVQFKPKSQEFAVDEERSPGYRVLDLYESGSMNTQVNRIKGFHPTE